MVSILEFSFDIYLQDKEKYGIVSIQLFLFVISELNKASGKSQAPAVFYRGKCLRQWQGDSLDKRMKGEVWRRKNHQLCNLD